MEKHLFRLVSRGSSNTLNTYGFDVEKMKKRTLLVLAGIIIASWMVGAAHAQTSILVSPPVVRPGETVIISGQSTANVLTVEISNTRTLVDSLNVTVVSGEFSLEYVVPSDAPVDVYTVLIGSSGETSFIVSKMTQEQLSNTVRALVLNAKKQAESALIQARKQGQTIPQEIRNLYMQGLAAITQAGNHIQNHNYVEAQESLQEALNRFREVVEYSYDDVAPQIDPEQERVRVQEIIDQLKHQYGEINTATQKLKQNGVNVDILEQQLRNLRNSIDNAQTLLDEGNIAEARQMAIRIQQLVKQRLTALRQKQAEITKRLADGYQLSLESRVGVYLNTFQKLQTIRPVASALAIQELESLQVRLAASGELLETGNIAAALREMHVTEYRLRNLANTVDGAVTSRLLYRIDELAAYLQESTGTDMSQIEKELEDAKDSLTDYLRENRLSPTTNSTLTP